MNATATEDNEKTNLRTKLQSGIEKAKEVWERLEKRTVAGARTADKAVRTRPYPAIGLAFGVGLLFGVLAMRSRRH